MINNYALNELINPELFIRRMKATGGSLA